METQQKLDHATNEQNKIVHGEQLLQIFSSCLDAFWFHMAILDESAQIVWVNAAWNKFALLNGALFPFGVGINYLEICDAARGDEAEGGRIAAAGIRRVLKGELGEFCYEYPCHSPLENRWYEMRVRRVLVGTNLYLLVTHEDVTQRR